MNLPEQETRPANNDTRLIPLTQGQYAIVDAHLYDWLMEYKWQAKKRTDGKFYASRSIYDPVTGKVGCLAMHRQILGISGRWVFGEHENGESLENTGQNLRVADPSQNRCNMGKLKNNSSGFKGVFFHRRSGWVAQGVIRRKQKWLGSKFATPEEAARAYDAWAVINHGKFARLNFPASQP